MTDSLSTMATGYHAPLVILSVVVATLASYGALGLAGQVTSASGSIRTAWLLGGAVVMGVGIWSMHFVGMLAFHLPVAIGYTVPFLLISVAIAIAASLLALVVVSKSEMSLSTLLLAGVLMGAAICGMHYVGMASMRVPASVSYDDWIVAASVLIAVVASIVALWLAFRFSSGESRQVMLLKPLAALVMGIAISGMHYTGMAAASFHHTQAVQSPGRYILASGQLGVVVGIGALIITLLAIAGTVIDRKVLQDQLVLTLELAAQSEMLLQHQEELTAQTEELASQTRRLELQNTELQAANAMLALQRETAHRSLAVAEAAQSATLKANEARTRFINMVSHELRTPLGALGGYLDLLLMGLRGPVNQAQENDLRRMKVNQLHLLRLINEILDLAKLEAGQMPVELRELRLRDILESAKPMVLPQIEAKHIALSWEVDESTSCVIGDPERIQQILINLIANSTRFTPEAGAIRIHACRVGDAVKIHITDTGPGIPDDKIGSLFSPFVQLGGSGELYVGTGLGLAISRELARAMGGDLGVQAESKNGGATFVLSLNAGKDETFVH